MGHTVGINVSAIYYVRSSFFSTWIVIRCSRTNTPGSGYCTYRRYRLLPILRDTGISLGIALRPIFWDPGIVPRYRLRRILRDPGISLGIALRPILLIQYVWLITMIYIIMHRLFIILLTYLAYLKDLITCNTVLLLFLR